MISFSSAALPVAPATLDELVKGHYLLDDAVLSCSKSGGQFHYHPVAPDAGGQPVVVSCVAPDAPEGKRPHGQGRAYVFLCLNGKVGVTR